MKAWINSQDGSQHGWASVSMGITSSNEKWNTKVYLKRILLPKKHLFGSSSSKIHWENHSSKSVTSVSTVWINRSLQHLFATASRQESSLSTSISHPRGDGHVASMQEGHRLRQTLKWRKYQTNTINPATTINIQRQSILIWIYCIHCSFGHIPR